MQKITIAIEGMTCGGCEASVKRALEQHDGVQSTQVSHRDGQAIVAFDEARLTPDALCQIIGEAGFQASHA